MNNRKGNTAAALLYLPLLVWYWWSGQLTLSLGPVFIVIGIVALFLVLGFVANYQTNMSELRPTLDKARETTRWPGRVVVGSFLFAGALAALAGLFGIDWTGGQLVFAALMFAVLTFWLCGKQCR